MEKKLKLRLPRLVRSSLNSCRNRNLYDVIETSTLNSQTASLQGLFPSVTKFTDTPPRPRVREAHYSVFYNPIERHTFDAPGLNLFSGNPFYDESGSFRAYDKDSKMRTKNTRKTIRRRIRKRSQVGSDYLFHSSSLDGSCRFKSTGSWCWSSDDDDDDRDNKDETKKESGDDETDTLFSSRSFSSDSSATVLKGKASNPRRQTEQTGEGSNALPENEKVRDSFAVVKKSSDPYDDFRKSMVEMIVERQIFAADDLRQLLQCFLLLNSRHHHGVIVEVFLEIYETLFSA